MRKTVVAAITIGTAVLLLLTVLYTAVTTRQPSQFDSGYRIVMGTFSRVVSLARSEEVARNCAEAALDCQRRVDERMSSYIVESELSQVNRQAFGQPVRVSEETFEVLQKARHFSELTGGAFDITIGPLGDLWRRAGDVNVAPTESEIADARSKVGYEKLLLDPDARTVRFAVEGTKLDLGGIAKGYAIDKSVQTMQQGGAVGGMVDIGGDVRCFGTPPKGKKAWVVGLQDPTVAPDDMATNKLLMTLSVTDAAVTTSGDYRRFTEIQGQRQSHILDAQSGRGAGKLVSVTIIAPDALTADALATAVSVLGLDKGLALIEQLPNTEAILIPNQSNAQPVFTTGARAYVRQ
jgi:thiamine biosynthesis lipoprotein